MARYCLVLGKIILSVYEEIINKRDWKLKVFSILGVPLGIYKNQIANTQWHCQLLGGCSIILPTYNFPDSV